MFNFKNSSYFSLLKLLPRELVRRLVLLVPLLGLAGALEVMSLASIAPLGTMALDPGKTAVWMARLGLHGISHYRLLAYLAVFTILIFCLKSLYVFVVTRFALHTASKARAFYQSILFDVYINAPYGYHLGHNSGDYIRNITSECISLDARFLTPSVVLLSEIIPVVFVTGLLLFVNPVGLLISVAIFMLAGYLVVRLTAGRLQRLGMLQLQADGNLIRLAQQSFHSPKEVAIYQIQPELSERFSRIADVSSVTVSKAQTLNQLPRFIFEIMSLGAVMVVATVALVTGASIHELIIQLGIFFGAVLKLLPSSNKIANHFQALNHARPTVDNIVSQIAEARDAARSHSVVRAKSGDGSPFMRLDAVDLAFSFPGRKPIFSGLDLTISRGEIVGLIGETGAGKTTLVNVLLGLLPPSSGVVELNGIDISVAGGGLGKRTGYVPQEIYLLDDTVANNISYFGRIEELDESRVKAVLEKVGMLEFVKALPQGIHTPLGEQGSRLSGGQRQRIGIARALYRNPEVLIFDEATSALDSQTEASITEAISQFKGEMTIIMIAHRLTTLLCCDRVLRLSGGALENMDAPTFRSVYQL